MDLMVFSKDNFNVRSIREGEEFWFVAKDVCEALGYVNHRDAVAKHVDEEDKRASRIATPSGEQEMVVINESGLYSLILRSNKPQARIFKRWITKEVIPSIRKYGSYSINRNPLEEEVRELKEMFKKLLDNYIELTKRNQDVVEASVLTRHNKRWSEKEIEKLVKLWEDGFGGMEIAKELGRSVGAVYRMLHRLRKIQ